jgi:hypothetical protein
MRSAQTGDGPNSRPRSGPRLFYCAVPPSLDTKFVAPGPCHRVQALKRGGAQSAYLITAFAAAAVASVMYIAMSRGGAEEGSGEAGGGAVGRAAGKDSTGTAGKGKRSRR